MSDVQVVVVDDEQPARKRLVDLVERTDGLRLQETCADGRAAIEVLLRTPPDVVLLDVQMPEIDGLEVVRLVGPDRMPVVVFVTAYDQYALRAFDVAAVDYLLKPFDDERFVQAMDRAVEHVRYRSLHTLTERMIDLVKFATPPDAAPEGDREARPTSTVMGDRPAPFEQRPPITRIAVQRRNEIRLVPADDIQYFEAQGSYVKVHTGEATYLIRERMKSLESRLDAERFCRIHRSTIVNLDCVCALEPNDLGDVVARLHDGTRLRVSRSRRDTLEARLGI